MPVIGKEAYAGMYLVISTLMAILLIKGFGKKDRLGKSLTKVIGAGLVIMLTYVLYLSTDNYMIMSIASSIEFAGLDWTLYFLAEFVARFTDQEKAISRFYKYLPIVLSIDGIVLLTNPLTDFAIKYEHVITSGGEYLVYKGQIPFNIHLGICYIMVAQIIGLLCYKSYNVAKLYRVRYSVFLVAFALVIALNAVFLVVGGYVDFSILAYSGLAGFVYFYVYGFKGKAAADAAKAYLIDQMNNPIVLFDYEGKMLMCNRRAAEILNLPEDITEEEFIAENDYLDIKNPKEKHLFESVIVSGEIVRYFQIRYDFLQDNKNRKLGTVFVYDDITEKKKALLQTEYNALHDLMTGTYNRNYIYEFKNQIEHSDAFPMYCAIYNINGLRSINENHGTHVGDKLLRRMAWLLQQYSSSLDYVIRMDGDEMLLVMPGVSERKAMEVYKKIEKRVNNLDIEDVHASASYVYFTLNSVEEFDRLYEDARHELSNKKKMKAAIENKM